MWFYSVPTPLTSFLSVLCHYLILIPNTFLCTFTKQTLSMMWPLPCLADIVVFCLWGFFTFALFTHSWCHCDEKKTRFASEKDQFKLRIVLWYSDNDKNCDTQKTTIYCLFLKKVTVWLWLYGTALIASQIHILSLKNFFFNASSRFHLLKQILICITALHTTASFNRIFKSSYFDGQENISDYTESFQR